MSTILKALRRLEEEKTATSEDRPLREEVASWSPAPPPSRRRWLPALAALVMGLLGGGTLFWVVHSFGASGAPGAPQVATAAPSAARPAPPVPQEPPPAAQRPEAAAADPAGPPDHAFASEVEVVRRPRAAPRVADSEPLQIPSRDRLGVRRPVADSAAAQRARQAALRRAQVAEQAAAPQRATAASRAIAPSPEPTPEPVASSTAPGPERPAPSGLPVVASSQTSQSTAVPDASAPPAPAVKPSVSASAPVAEPPVARAPTPPQPAEPVQEPVAPSEPTRAGEAVTAAATPAAEVAKPPLPSIAVERTEWHPVPERRAAWVVVGSDTEPRRVSEGDVVEGLRVAKIEPSGVVFDRGGETLRRAVGAGG